ncbi:MAG: nucleotide exchange factor GrpE [Actinomycetales bacterium]|nr:nucleotide exchange factor GrpE [Actinomycetales bacterium]
MTESQDPGYSFQDKRRIDPETFEVREPPAAPAPGSGDSDADDEFAGIVEGLVVEEELADVDSKVAELTADLQRVHAEYANYRKRVDRDREANRDAAVGGSLAELLPVLDDIGRAREHGDLDGAFKAVAEALEAAVTRQGLERFGAAGDEFDPTVHEAITHTHSPDVTVTTCVSVFQPGYRFKGRILRPAIVAVADPEQ